MKLKRPSEGAINTAIQWGSLATLAVSWVLIAGGAEAYAKENFDLGTQGSNAIGISTLLAGLIGTTILMDKRGGTHYYG